MPVLNFKCKGTVYSHHLGLPFCPLMIDEKKSVLKTGEKQAFELDDNLIIQGDNLYALKALLSRYAGKVNCIYIDPPYNTGNEGWKYNDNANSPVIQEWLKQNGIGIDDLERHDKWLCMMWPRLQLLKELLAESGVIFISIDDNEQHHLRMIMDEIFGEQNFVTQFIWEKKKKPSFLHKNVGVVTDCVICYLKNKEHSFPFSIEKTTEGKRFPLNRAGNKVSILNFPKGSVQFSCEDQEIQPQDMSEGEIKTQLMDKCVIKNGTNLSDFRLKGEWGYSQKTLDKVVLKGERISISKIPFRPNHVKKGGEVKKMKNLLSLHHYQTPTNEDATKEMINIFGKPVFTNPKPSGLIKKLIQSVTYDKKNAIILDSFAGSGTTAQAVLELNKEDGGQRQFILVECEGYANKITAERVRRVIKGVPQSKDEQLKKGLGGSFTYCTLGKEMNEENLIKGNSLPSYKVLSSYVYYIATGQTLNKVQENKDFYIGKTKKDTAFFVIYKKDIKFLRSKECALNLDRKEKIQNLMRQKKCPKAVVFAPVHYFDSSEELAKEGIIFCQLPFAIYEVAGA